MNVLVVVGEIADTAAGLRSTVAEYLTADTSQNCWCNRNRRDIGAWEW